MSLPAEPTRVVPCQAAAVLERTTSASCPDHGRRKRDTPRPEVTIEGLM